MADGYCPFCLTKKSGPFCPKCGLPEDSYKPATRDLPPGSILEKRYYVGRKLGEGGFGITYAGIDTVLESRIAIKEYFPSGMAGRYAAQSSEIIAYTGGEADYDRGKANFVKEARIMARMNKQPEIADCMDFFEANNTAYIIMEYVDGPTLKERVLNSGPFEPEQFFSLIKPVMKALANMHKAGIIHRDISPDNLIIERDRLRLIDFGCAREDITSELTMTLMLKHGFSPVEQYQRKGQGPWTDVYALAATMYYCLTGRVAPQAVDRLIEDEIIPPSKFANITPKQESAILKAMAVRVEDRFKSAEEFSHALYDEETAPDPAFVYAAQPVPASEAQPAAVSVSAPKEPEDKPDEAEVHIYFVKIEEIFEEAKTDAEKIIAGYGKISRKQAKGSIEAFFKGHSLKIMLEKKEEAFQMVSELKAKRIRAEIEEAGRENIPEISKEEFVIKTRADTAGEKKPDQRPKESRRAKKTMIIAAAAAAAALVIIVLLFLKPWQTNTVKHITAQEAETTQEEGEWVWDYDETSKTLTISGTGRMEDYEDTYYVPWWDYRGEIESVIIEEGITYIGAYAFSELEVAEIALPESLEEIGEYAFYFSDLSSVTIPDNVESIGRGAFAVCYSIEEFIVGDGNENFVSQDGILYTKDMTCLVCYPGSKTDTQYDIPESVETLYPESLNANYYITTINIPESVTDTGEANFYLMSNLAEINVSEENSEYTSADGILFTKDMTVILAYPIGKFSESYSIPDTVTEIGSYAFAETYYLEEAVFPEGLQKIDSYAFFRSNITEVSFPESLTEIGDYAFYECDGLTEVVFPDNLTEIGDYAFCFCYNLAAVDFPESLTVIGEYAFQSCGSLTEAVFPEGLEEIGKWAFSYCDSLESVVFPESINMIGEHIFMSCESLTAVYYRGTKKQWNLLKADGYIDESLSEVTVYYEYDGDQAD